MKKTFSITLLLLLATSCVNTEDSQGRAETTATITPGAARQPVTSTSTHSSPASTLSPISTPSPSATPTCTQVQGFIEERTYQSPVLKAEIPYRVYLPACYEQTTLRYPTLYLLHGFPFDETQWDELGIFELADDEIASGRWSAFIMVMPRLPEPLFTSTDGGPNSYEAEMVDGLIPIIDRRYRTDPLPLARAVVGISRGGVWALEIAFRHPELFDTVAALSPALHVNFASAPYDPLILATKDQPLPANIILTAGDGELGFRQASEELSAVLATHDVPHELIIGSGGHDAQGWASVFGHVLETIQFVWRD